MEDQRKPGGEEQRRKERSWISYRGAWQPEIKLSRDATFTALLLTGPEGYNRNILVL